MKKLFFLLFFTASFALGQTTEFRANPVPKTTGGFDLGQSWLVWDSLYVNYLINTNPLLSSRGGTGLSSFTAGDIPYYASGTALSKLAIGAVGKIIRSTGTAPAWTVSLSENAYGLVTVADTLVVTDHLKQSGGSVWFDGTTGAAPTTGAGTRFMWIPEKKSLLAGTVAGTEWDSLANYSYIFGQNSKISAAGNNNFIAGASNTIGGASVNISNSAILGLNNTISSTSWPTFVFGRNNTVNSASGIGGNAANFVLGFGNTLSGDASNAYIFGPSFTWNSTNSYPVYALGTGGTLRYSQGFYVQSNQDFPVAINNTSLTQYSSAYFVLTSQETVDTTTYHILAQKQSSGAGTGVADFILERGYNPATAGLGIADYIQFMRYSASDGSITFNHSKTRGSFGDVKIANGNLNLASLTASRLVASDASKNFASTITLANFVSSVSDATGSTGTGKFVMNGTPTLVTPNIGAATGTSVNLTGAGTFGGDITTTGGNFLVDRTGATASLILESNTSGNANVAARDGATNKFIWGWDRGQNIWRITTQTITDALELSQSGSLTVTDDVVGNASLYIADTIKAGPTGGGTPYSYFIPGGALVQSSSQDLKENIRSYSADLSKFKLVKPRKYNFRKENFLRLFDESTLSDTLTAKEKGDRRAKFRADNLKEAEARSKREMIGFLAEEFNQNLFGKSSKEINQADIINVMWLKIQELESRIEVLEKR